MEQVGSVWKREVKDVKMGVKRNKNKASLEMNHFWHREVDGSVPSLQQLVMEYCLGSASDLLEGQSDTEHLCLL